MEKEKKKKKKRKIGASVLYCSLKTHLDSKARNLQFHLQWMKSFRLDASDVKYSIGVMYY